MPKKATAQHKPKSRLRAVEPQPVYHQYISPLPPNVTPEDCMALEITNAAQLFGYGIFPGDLCLGFRTKDIQSGDMVYWRKASDPEGTNYFGRFYPSPGGRVRFEGIEEGERAVLVYRSEEVVIWGRLFAVERGGRVVHLPIEVREGGAI